MKAKRQRANKLFGWTKTFHVRRSIIQKFTGQRTGSLYHMEALELDRMIEWLEERNESMNKIRRKCYHLTGQRGWVNPNGKPDMDRLDQFLLKHGAIKKKLNEQNYDELMGTVNQMERVSR